MSKRSGEMKLGAFLRPPGHHVAAWRHPDAVADAGVNIGHYVGLAQTAERGLFDMIFMADTRHGVRGAARGAEPHLLRGVVRAVLAACRALAMETKRIGLVCTATTTYNEPFHIARRFARSTRSAAAERAGTWSPRCRPRRRRTSAATLTSEHAERYKRAHEFAEVVRGFGNRWDDRRLHSRQGSRACFFDPAKMHELNHKRRITFSVRGPLNVARSPQGRPVMVQAGSSDDGHGARRQRPPTSCSRRSRSTRTGARAFYADVKRAARKYGREPDDVKIMPGMFPVVGRTSRRRATNIEAAAGR